MSLATVTRNSAVAGASHAPWPQSSETLTTIFRRWRRFFYRNSAGRSTRSVATDFNLAGMDEWIANFRHICQIDCYDGRHPNVFVPRPVSTTSSQRPRRQRLPAAPRAGRRAHRGARDERLALFLMFDETTKEICREMGLSVCFPGGRAARALQQQGRDRAPGQRGSRRAQRAQRARPCQELPRAAPAGGCRRPGQAPGRGMRVGDSGHTTFFRLEPRRLAASRGGHRGRVRG